MLLQIQWKSPRLETHLKILQRGRTFFKEIFCTKNFLARRFLEEGSPELVDKPSWRWHLHENPDDDFRLANHLQLERIASEIFGQGTFSCKISYSGSRAPLKPHCNGLCNGLSSAENLRIEKSSAEFLDGLLKTSLEAIEVNEFYGLKLKNL